MGPLNNVVLGTLHMYHNKIPRLDVIEILETGFEESEMFGALKALQASAGLDAPQGRQTSPNKTAAQAYAVDLLECMTRLVSEGKLPEIVVSSNDLSKVPLNKKRLDNADVTTVNCRLEALEEMMKNVVNTMNKMSEKPSFTGIHSGTVPKVVVGDHGGGGVPVAAVSGQGHVTRDVSRDRGVRERSPAIKRSYNDVVKEASENGNSGEFQQPKGRRQPRKMAYGTNKVEMAGAEAAPIEVFVGNTNPRATEDIIKKVLLKCADNMTERPELEILEVKLLTNPERDPNPRFKSWKVTVPYSCKSLMEDDSFYPNGWSHRKYFPKRVNHDRNMRAHLDPTDPVNMELARNNSA